MVGREDDGRHSIVKEQPLVLYGGGRIFAENNLLLVVKTIFVLTNDGVYYCTFV